MVVPTTIGPGFEAGTPAALFAINVLDLVLTSGNRYDVTPDGQRFVVHELTGRVNPSALTVVVTGPPSCPKSARPLTLRFDRRERVAAICCSPFFLSC
jgi:hypothetical protein